MTLTFILLFLATPCGFAQIAQFTAADMAVETLENWKPHYTPEDLMAAVAMIREKVRVGDKRVNDALLRTLQNPASPIKVRIQALDLLCEKADARTASRIIELATGWVQPAAKRQFDHAAPEPALLYSFMTKGAYDLQDKAIDHNLIVTVAKEYLSRLLVIGEARRSAIALIAESPVPAARKSGCAMELIGKARSSTQFSIVLVGLLDESSFPQLRTLVRDSVDTDQFHFGAASALAHLGDQVILPDLEAARPRLRQMSKNYEGYVEGYIWKINAQHPPEKLLNVISEYDERRSAGIRVWALWRAVELRLPTRDIRAAVLAYAETMRQREDGYRFLVASLKDTAVRLGVLGPDELPDVRGLTSPSPR